MNAQEHEAYPGTATPVAPHMTPEELRLWGGRFLDWVAGYHERIESYPVLSQVRPGEVSDGLPQSPPAEPEGFDAVLCAELGRDAIIEVLFGEHSVGQGPGAGDGLEVVASSSEGEPAAWGQAREL